jgi:hypothetical protein
MINVTFTECVRPPPVPVMVNVRVRRCTFGSVSMVSTELPLLTTAGGLNVLVARPGAPVTDRFTVPEKPVPAVIVTV